MRKSELTDSKGSSDSNIQQKTAQVEEKVLPEEGSPTGYGIKFSTNGMKEMASWYRDINLDSSEEEKYVSIGTEEGTSCEYCCGATKAVADNGKSACGCEHNFALAGLIKYLVKNTDKSKGEILDEVQAWKGYFFPKQTLSKELEERNIDPQSAGLPDMRGGC